MNNLEQIVCQYYKDKNGNPMSYHIRRNHQVSPKNYQIQLDGVPDEYRGIEVIEPIGFSRVYNPDEITEKTYWVRNDGNVFFHKTMACKEVKMDYYSIGLPVVGCGRIYTLLDEEGNVIETLEDILSKGKTVVEALKTMNDVIVTIDELKTTQFEAIKCKEVLDTGIDEADRLLHALNEIDFVKNKTFTDTVEGINKEIKKTNDEIEKNKKSSDKIFEENKKDETKFREDLLKTSPRNLVRNPIFNTGDYRCWTPVGTGCTAEVKPETSLGHEYALELECKKKGEYVKQTVKGLQLGKEYVFRVKMKVESGTPEIMITNNGQNENVKYKTEQGHEWIDLKVPFVAKETYSDICIGNFENDDYVRFIVTEIMVYEGVFDIPFMDNLKEVYDKTLQVSKDEIMWGDGKGTFSRISKKDGDLEFVMDGVVNKYVTLKYETCFNIPSGNPGVVNIKLPKEFTKKKDSLIWCVFPKGYYYNTYYNFFPFFVAVNKKGSEEKDGHIICTVEGYCRIQNGNKPSDIQDESLNAILIAFA